jgi:hypothetical protein
MYWLPLPTITTLPLTAIALIILWRLFKYIFSFISPLEALKMLSILPFSENEETTL